MEVRPETQFVYDPETERYFPISAYSLKVDPPLVTPDPDPELFPNDFLSRLMSEADDPRVPGVWEFVWKAWTAFDEFVWHWSRYHVSWAMFRRILSAIRFTQIFHAFALAVALSVVRFVIQQRLLPLSVTRLGIPLNTSKRLIESSWKAFWFSVLWLISLYTIILSGRRDFQYPLGIFAKTHFVVGYFDVPTPWDYYVLYTFQLAFYLHSLWSLVFVDSRSKDSTVLLVHHCVALLLIQFSLVMRLHRIGALVVFLHDINDVFLELAKINVYLRERHGQLHLIHEKLANSLFVVFCLSWILTRLYWFPLKVLYSTSWGVYISHVGRCCVGFLFMNSMLWVLLLMHIYWFRFIMIMAFRLLLYPPSCDIREEGMEDEDDEISSKPSSENGQVCNGDVRKRT